jgi:hypothetical protein
MAISRLRQAPRIIVVVVVVQSKLRELIALRQLLRKSLLRVVVGLLFLCIDIIIIIVTFIVAIIVVGVVWAHVGIADIRSGGEGIVHDGVEIIHGRAPPGQPRR